METFSTSSHMWTFFCKGSREVLFTFKDHLDFWSRKGVVFSACAFLTFFFLYVEPLASHVVMQIAESWSWLPPPDFIFICLYCSQLIHGANGWLEKKMWFKWSVAHSHVQMLTRLKYTYRIWTQPKKDIHFKKEEPEAVSSRLRREKIKIWFFCCFFLHFLLTWVSCIIMPTVSIVRISKIYFQA